MDSVCEKLLQFVSFSESYKLSIYIPSDRDRPDSPYSSDIPAKPKRDFLSEISKHDEHGWPIIPSRGDRSLQECKDVIRAYVTATYR